MREIRTLNESHIDAYTEIAYNAYPSFKDFSKEAMAAYKVEVTRIMKEDPIVTFFGMFEDEELIAVMRLFDFEMNAFGKVVPVSGIGFLGVHLMHKKKKVARQMVEFYEKHYLNKGVPIATLLPFRPDFYHRMGYGHGTKMHQYRIETARIPAYKEMASYKLQYMKQDHMNEILACHERVVRKSHGRMMKFGDEKRDLFGEESNRVIGSYDESGNLKGYMVYKFINGKAGNYTINHLYVKELIYENAKVLQTFLGYLRKQEDQVALVIFNTEDEHFHYLFENPLNDTHNYIPYGYLETNTQAIGVMYKLLDVSMAFEQCAHRNYNGVNLKVRFDVEDPIGGDIKSVIVHFENGKAVLGRTDYDVTFTAPWAEFSALFLGCTGVRGLYELGLVKISNEEALADLDLAFYYHQKPVCYTDF